MSDNPAKQARKLLQHQADRDRALLRSRGENRGWDLVESDGIPVWQFIKGGKFHPIVRLER